MARRVYRVCRSIHRRLDGFGAKLAGGRWNSQGHAVVYMAESVSLAVLENLVHMSREDFPVGYVCIGASIPDHLAILEESDLRQGFPTLSTANLGDLWIESLASAVLRVRSAVVFAEYNYLLNPAHPQFREITVEETAPFTFDGRLFR
jgi:RES domain-containing protein